MTNEHAKAQLADILDGVQAQMRAIAQVQQERARIVATATVRKRVTVSVNADFKVIETKFGADIGDLTYPEIARAVTEAAQQACAEITRRTAAMMSPLQDNHARLPKITDMVEDMPDLMVPQPVEASMAPPHAPERQVDAPEAAQYEAPTRPGSATDSSW
ncbi:YbaB/EbfC family nucleoid-associated protein [Nocardia sp. AG03]|uniref:YbaB/EbfC family nucleoid-associated protein n=1 Tax=Nocardia sp. AG03 TaxID=3025312 RepID=UPI002418B2AF|nr:YbaB/EbfC family nucleoid-associated protein [Nocardia sp. AG03]